MERPRRLRRSERLRTLVRETEIRLKDLIQPLFIVPGTQIKREITSLRGQYHFSVDRVVAHCQELEQLGVTGVLLFGLPESKDSQGSGAYHSEGIIQKAVQAIKSKVPKLLVITDICLCAYTDHGHCGMIQQQEVVNDPSVEILRKVALSHAQAGADMVAPSDMMDGRIGAIREELDQHHFSDISIMSYAVKYASAFYGPFRSAANSAPAFGDRSTYQMDPANSREALKEARLDDEEGADILMVKPALPYLDIIYQLRQFFDKPIAAYHVSGEYAMIHAAADAGLLQRERAMLESLISIKRAGADIILTYATEALARSLLRP
ncbi:MAG: porphobilinogen synthase [Planctomycetota bacterium]